MHEYQSLGLTGVPVNLEPHRGPWGIQPLEGICWTEELGPIHLLRVREQLEIVPTRYWGEWHYSQQECSILLA